MRIALVSFFDSRRRRQYPAQHMLSAMRLGAYLAKLQPAWTIRLRAYAESDDPAIIAAGLLSEHFDVIGLPVYIWTREKALWIAEKLAASIQPPLIVLGGPETQTLNSGEWPAPAVFVLGQGEEPLYWLCERRVFDPGFDGTSIPLDSPYAVFSNARGREQVAHRPLATKDMKRLPHGLPLFSDEYQELLDEHSNRDQFAWYETARGCIYSCSFCGHNTLPFFAEFDLDFVRCEVALLRKRGIQRIFLIDPILGGRASRGKEVLRIFQQCAPEIKITAYMRPEFLDAEFVELLSGSNIAELLMGLQTTNPNVPQHVRNNNFQKIMRYVPTLAQRGVPWRAELIVGLPGDDLPGLRESLRFTIDELQPWSVHTYHLTAIPETRLFSLLDKTDEAYWIQADNRLRITCANSFNSIELGAMLAYAGAATSLHSFMREHHSKPTKFAEIDTAVRQLLETIDPELIRCFRKMDISAGMEVWQEVWDSTTARSFAF